MSFFELWRRFHTCSFGDATNVVWKESTSGLSNETFTTDEQADDSKTFAAIIITDDDEARWTQPLEPG